MSSEFTLSEVRYNAACARFEATVTVTDGNGLSFTYDCDYDAPLTAPAPAVSAALVTMARKRHSGDVPGLRMQRVSHVQQRLSALSGPSLVSTLLGNFEALFSNRAA